MSNGSQAALRACRRVLEQNSKSFALAARLLPASSRDEVAAVYAFCRRVDDAIDDTPPAGQAAALSKLYEDLERVYRGEVLSEASLAAFQAVVRRRGIPRRYPSELIEGMAMDVRDTRYLALHDLLLYCHRVAAVVGLMMCHVFGLRSDRALHNAAHLGIAMQLTNICRDVEEDWRLGRLYLPHELLVAAGAGPLARPGIDAFPDDGPTLQAMRSVISRLLSEAERYYASADQGIAALPFRAGLAVRAARRLYHAIGLEIAAQDHDPSRGRAVVPTQRKLRLVGRAVAHHAGALPIAIFSRSSVQTPTRELSFPEDVLA